ncbi:family 3 encapsulin nanocompartment shell protein [Ramlibacter sp.]|uniref:family 3 encapsulin nanocompartment shell protein n=1 Tax=Ramlibacter sp. TaxID=1917967 RepID=UPI0017A8FD1A|nr:family 3 encapsulin nanocompartment shell protein [Ramlibacter sp.]MBA2676216.1 phage major capsid protein [Ramlibacter sp.]
MSSQQQATQATEASSGELFARAFRAQGANTEVRFDFTITEAFKPTLERPRLMVSQLFKKRLVEQEQNRFWTETRPPKTDVAGIFEGQLRQEATFRFGMGESTIRPINAWVQIPEGLEKDERGLAEFIDYRLLVRLATAENQALTLGPAGLLNTAGLTQVPYDGDYLSGIMEASNLIEQNGATAHAMIVNPVDYYHRMMGKSILEDLARNGAKIVRTRMVAPGCALLGDFAVAARILHTGKSVIRVGTPPKGTFATEGLAVIAEIYEGLAVHLPTHFFHVKPRG